MYNTKQHRTLLEWIDDPVSWLLILSIITSQETCSLLQQIEVTDVSHDQCHVTQAGVGLVGAPER